MEKNTNFRPMRRFKQQLPIFLYTGNHIYFHSAIRGHKIDAINRSPKDCFTVIDSL